MTEKLTAADLEHLTILFGADYATTTTAPKKFDAFEVEHAAMVVRVKAEMARPGFGTGDVAKIVKTAMYLAQNNGAR